MAVQEDRWPEGGGEAETGQRRVSPGASDHRMNHLIKRRRHVRKYLGQPEQPKEER